jgi:dipeptidyl-peptidase 4
MQVGLNSRSRIFAFALVFVTIAPAALFAQYSPATDTGQPGQLTVERIYSQPSLSGSLTRGLVWSPDGRQLSFLETNGAGREAKTELWSMDPATGKRTLLVPADKLEGVLPAPTTQTQATGAGRHAPLQYQWAPGSDALFFVGGESLAWLDLKSQTSRVLISGRGALSDVKISPDGKYVSFIREHNIWLVGVADGKERAFTTGGIEETRKGELDWVYPEELDLLTAYWWAPDSNSIAYLQMDERPVSQFPMVDFQSTTGQADLQRYPVAGGKNPVVHVFVAPVNGGEAQAMDTGSDTNVYIARVNWLTDSHHVAIQRLNRDQNQLDLLLADVSTGKSSMLLSETDKYWINVSDNLHFLKDGKRFLCSSERSGFRHLYLYDLNGKVLAQLTHGDWEVSHLQGVDEAKGLVYFTATEKSPLERQLYRVSLDGNGFTRVTKEEGTHSPQLSPDNVFFVDTYSNVMTPPRQDLYRVDGARSAVINENKVPELAQYHLSPVQFVTVKSRDGVSLNAFVIKPPQFDPNKKHPVIVYTYGGPHAQVVLNAWERENFLWSQMMAQHGYIIFALDNRGSFGRGHAFEASIYHQLGVQELADQRDGVAWLQQQPWADSARIGIWGWSYGGYMTLQAMFEAADLFKVGFAGGPVTDWHYYDSIYTERYMGLPEKNPEGYKNCSPVMHATGLKGKLLIAHGTGDDNVHYSNTLDVINSLISDGKYVEVIAAPGRGHGASDPAARKIIFTRVMQFFLDNL